MNINWLSERDAEFFKNRYREYCAQLTMCNSVGLKGYAELIREKMERLLTYGKLTKAEGSSIETDVRACQAQTEAAWKEYLATLGR